MSFYALRYLPTVPLKDRKHRHIEGRHETWLDAETAREALPDEVGRRLDVVERDGMGGGRG